MPTVITHGIVGLAGAAAFSGKKYGLRFFVLSALCAALPDADTIGFRLGVEYAAFFGHRGFFHSIAFAAVLAAIVVLIFYRRDKARGRESLWLFIYFFLISASHGILDAFTSGGLGIALLAPFDNGRIFFPWTPIAVAPIGIRPFFTEWGVRVMKSEIQYVWVPVILAAAFIRFSNARFSNQGKDDYKE